MELLDVSSQPSPGEEDLDAKGTNTDTWTQTDETV